MRARVFSGRRFCAPDPEPEVRQVVRPNEAFKYRTPESRVDLRDLCIVMKYFEIIPSNGSNLDSIQHISTKRKSSRSGVEGELKNVTGVVRVRVRP